MVERWFNYMDAFNLTHEQQLKNGNIDENGKLTEQWIAYGRLDSKQREIIRRKRDYLFKKERDG